ncbi:PTS sugar transporter subunit IIA [Oceanirhabdus seepicola]|uniref:Ascorbate-specific PTS system EIIA component n=1 Tax=Oceanirhabdus seepicola TaxID=2828781 RepID=A0A9J6NX75_9CLOT|nr:PTS sugar transporter subunit IIA [Oceanirhabdus seepicola]MCM1989058.1 PTS sugar transporter subunit IIA [Oceanirhabdus seepicola]
MIAGFELTREFIQFQDEVHSWQDAIVESSRPLLEKGYIEQTYVDAMIDSVKKYGPYIVIAPQIALPHARPDRGAKKAGFSILKLEKPVAFSEEEDHNVQLLIVLSCEDSSTHMELLQAIVTILANEEKQKLVFQAKTPEELLDIFS